MESRKMWLVVAALVGVVGMSSAGYVQTFDNFQLGALVAQEGWEANATVTVEETANSGLYIGGRALKANSSSDEYPRAAESSLDLGLNMSEAELIRISFDVREGINPDTGTTVFGARMHLRQGATANFGPAFGTSGGVSNQVMLRTSGEAGTNFYGNTLNGSTLYGPDAYWEKGDWLRFTLELTGANFSVATVIIENLSKGGLLIPSGIENVDTSIDYKSKAGTWNRPTFRLNGSTDTYVDNVAVSIVPEPATMLLLGLGSLLLRKRR